MEGCSRDSKKELRNFLNISIASAAELEVLMRLAQKLEYLKENEIIQRIEIIRRKIYSYRNKIILK